MCSQNALCGDALRDGAVVLSNAPYNGGTHLPDVTAISAQMDDGKIQFSSVTVI